MTKRKTNVESIAIAFYQKLNLVVEREFLALTTQNSSLFMMYDRDVRTENFVDGMGLYKS